MWPLFYRIQISYSLNLECALWRLGFAFLMRTKEKNWPGPCHASICFNHGCSRLVTRLLLDEVVSWPVICIFLQVFFLHLTRKKSHAPNVTLSLFLFCLWLLKADVEQEKGDLKWDQSLFTMRSHLYFDNPGGIGKDGDPEGEWQKYENQAEKSLCLIYFHETMKKEKKTKGTPKKSLDFFYWNILFQARKVKVYETAGLHDWHVCSWLKYIFGRNMCSKLNWKWILHPRFSALLSLFIQKIRDHILYLR